MKREAMGHTKMKRLCRRLDIALWQGVGLMESLWHLTAREAPRGDIGKLSNEDIALGIDYRGDEESLIAALIASGWLEQNDKFRLVIHDWDQHADDAVHMRLARALEFFSTGCAPKYARLAGKDRERAHEFYTACAQNIIVSAPPEPVPEPEPEPVPERSTHAVTSTEVPAGVFELPLPGEQGEWSVPQGLFDELVKLYPDVSVMDQLAKMRAWLLTNPRKTAKGLPRFMNNWLSRAQNDSPRRNTNAKPNRIDAILESTNATLAARRNRGLDGQADSDGGGAHPVTTARSLFERPHAQLVAQNSGRDR